ncbi:hypothetical protein EDD22DRAFT_883739 [Suillus occidentalis]|nr:hypothetical protein EDD22DRAFT_883739 [Suillus occidentalis]
MVCEISVAMFLGLVLRLSISNIRQISTVLRWKVYDYCFRGFEPQRTLRDIDVPAIPMLAVVSDGPGQTTGCCGGLMVK